MGEIRGLTEEDANQLLLALAKGGKKARELLNFALNWKKGDDTRGVMGQDQPDKRPRTGLGDFWFGEADDRKGGPEALEQYAYGMGGPWGVGEGQVIPHLKPGRGEQAANVVGSVPLGSAVDLATAGKAGMTATVPAIMGAVRKKGDVVTPELAQKLAARILTNTNSGETPTRALSVDYQNIIDDKLARYIQSIAGTENDPLKKLPMWEPPNSLFYPDAIQRGAPLLPPEVKGGASAPDFRMKVRPELEMPSETTQAAGIDDLIGRSLEQGHKNISDIRTLKPGLDIPEDQFALLEKITELLQGPGYGVSRNSVEESLDNRFNRLATGSGIWRENLPKVLESLPDGAIIASGLPGSVSAQEAGLRANYGSQKFADFIEKYPVEKLQKMKFEDIAQQFAKHNEQAFNAWGLTARGPVVHEGYTSPKGEWQLLDNENALLFQGISSDICVGQSSYCNDVRSGKQMIWGFRDKETQKPLLTINAKKQRSQIDATLPDHKEAQKALGGTIELLGGPEQADALITKIGELYGVASGRPSWGEDFADLLRKGDMDVVPEYFRVLGRPEEAEKIRKNAGRYQAIKDFYSEMGFNVPEGYGTSVEKWVVDQVKGRKNYVEDIPPELKKEAEAFVADMETKGIDFGSSSDWERIRRRMAEEETPDNARTALGLSENDLERIASLYEPGGQFGTKAYGRNWLVNPGERTAYTVDKGATLQAPFDPDVDTGYGKTGINIGGLEPNSETGRVRTELGRAVKGATEPHELVKKEVDEMLAKRAEKERELAERLARMQRWTRPGYEDIVYMRDGDTVYWNDYGDLRTATLEGNRLTNRRYVEQYDMPRALQNRFRERLAELGQAGIDDDVQAAATRIIPDPDRNVDHLVLEMENGFYFLDPDDADRVVWAERMENGAPNWDNAVYAVDDGIINERRERRIRERLQAQ